MDIFNFMNFLLDRLLESKIDLTMINYAQAP